jgi:hypothetical protein
MLSTSSGLVPPPVERHRGKIPRPTAFVHREGLLPGVLLLVLSAIWIGVPLRALTMSDAEPIPGLGTPGALAALMIGAGFALWSFDALTRRRMIVIDDHGATVQERRLGRVREWRAPLADYLGVHVRSQKIRTPRGRKLLHFIELRHSDPDRTVVLAMSKDRGEAMHECRSLAQALGLGQPEDSGAGAIPLDALDRRKTDADASPKTVAAEPGAVPARV